MILNLYSQLKLNSVERHALDVALCTLMRRHPEMDTVWIALDPDGDVYVYSSKPHYDEGNAWWDTHDTSGDDDTNEYVTTLSGQGSEMFPENEMAEFPLCRIRELIQEDINQTQANADKEAKSRLESTIRGLIDRYGVEAFDEALNTVKADQ